MKLPILHRAWQIATLLCLTSLAAGCATIGQRDGGAPPKLVAYEEARVIYRSDSDRMNLASPASHSFAGGQGQLGLLPNFAVATLELRYPHPNGTPDQAQGRLVVDQGVQDSALQSTGLLECLGIEDSAGDSRVPSAQRQVTTLDIPKWQMDRIVAELRSSNFFERSRVLSPDVFIAANVDGRKNGKNFKAIPELDTLILAARQQGRPQGAGSNGISAIPRPPGTVAAPSNSVPWPALSRLPAVANPL